MTPSPAPPQAALWFAVWFAQCAVAQNPGWDASAIRGRGGESSPYSIIPYLPDTPLERPVEALPVPGAKDTLIAAELNGRLWSIPLENDDTLAGRPMLLRMAEPSQRLYSIAFYPWGREPTDLLAVIHQNDGPGQRRNTLMRFPWNGPQSPLNDGSIILQWPTAGHDGSDIEIGTDGMVYVTSGDGQAPGDPANTGQRTDDWLGSILRIDIRVPPYTVPADNPFIEVEGVRPEVWAYGLRNPWRMGQDHSGRLWIGDNGEDLWEMLHLGKKGANYGWSAFEGGRPFRPQNLGGPVSEITPPVITWPHSVARSLIGGPEYSGQRFPELRGKILYGDYTTGALWAFAWDEEGQSAGPSQWLARAPSFLGFGTTPEGEPILLGADGALWTLQANPSTAPVQPFPERLSATGLFQSTSAGTLAPGVHRYRIAMPRWADGATAERFIALPDHRALQPFKNRAWNLPEGSVAGLTYSLDGRPIETQLITFQSRAWRFYTYAWEPDGSDALLVPAEGRVAPTGSEHRWRWPSRAECRMCHTAQSGFLLGFTPWQVTEDSRDDAEALSDALRRRGEHDIHDFPTWTGEIPEETAHIERLARAYLHSNCAHCHREGALGGRADFQLLAQIPSEEWAAIDARPRLDITPHPDNRLIAPGAPHRSAILHRMRAIEGGRMPLLGSTTPDRRGLKLLETWIQQLPRTRSESLRE